MQIPAFGKKIKRKSIAFIIARYIVLVAFAYILVYPFLYMGINSVKAPADWYDPTVQWIPKTFSLSNLKVAVEYLDYWKSIISTLKNEIVAALISFVSCAVYGYGLARFEFRGKKVLTALMILCILIPDALIIIPSYDNFRHPDLFGIFGALGKLTNTELRPNLINSPLVFWLPALLGVGCKNGLFIYIYSQFYKGLPKELEEAAYIDGAGPWKTFLKIMVPSSQSAAITVLIFSVVWYWNDYYLSQIYLSNNFPISVVLANFHNNLSVDISSNYHFSIGSLLLTSCFISVAPMILFFLILQRNFVSGIATSGIVG